jgi:hypothetical protein
MFLGLIDQKRRDVFKKRAQDLFGLYGQCRFRESVRHQQHPSIARTWIDSERHVPRAQPRVTPLLNVARRSAKPEDQELAKALLGAGHVRPRIHWPEHVIPGHLPVEGRDQSPEAVFSDQFEYLVFG